MLPKTHILINLAISLILSYYLDWYLVLIFFLSSVLIDFDHYLYYIVQENKYSLKGAYDWFLVKQNKLKKLSYKERKKHLRQIWIFHGIEPLALVYVLSIYYPLAIFIFYGFLVHLIEDLLVARKVGTIEHRLSLFYSVYDSYLKKKKTI